MKVHLQPIDPEGHPRGEIITTGAGRILVVSAACHVHPHALQAIADDLASFVGPDERAIVLPHGWRLKVLQPVEVPDADAA